MMLVTSQFVGVRMTATNRTEAALLEQVTALCELYGWRWTHFRPAFTGKGWRTALSGSAGFPDLVLVSSERGRVIFAELKSDTGKTSGQQQAWLVDLTAAGQECYIWRPGDLEAIADTLRRIDRPTQ